MVTEPGRTVGLDPDVCCGRTCEDGALPLHQVPIHDVLTSQIGLPSWKVSPVPSPNIASGTVLDMPRSWLALAGSQHQ